MFLIILTKRRRVYVLWVYELLSSRNGQPTALFVGFSVLLHDYAINVKF